VASQGEVLAVFGQLQQDVAREYKLRQAVWVAEIDVERLLDFSLRSRQFRPFSKFPAVERDFSLVVPAEVPYARLSAAVTGLAIEEIRGFRPVDSFPERHSLLLRVTFQSPSRTLTSAEVEGLGERLLAALAPLGVRLRS
jgi:phenylalanyl-tRNA synthetase beta chain